ncbi:MAG: AAA family ATPase [Tannerellaceae bacterium]|nr:AAA family ATPase [Tannerellaceae bacterium]
METNFVETTDLSLRELEEAVICCLLVKTNTLPDVVRWLRPEMFYVTDLGFVYNALLAQYNRGEQPDYLTTESEMYRMDADRCTEIGGIGCVGKTFHRIHHTGNLTLYAQEVKRRYVLRSLKHFATALSEKAEQADSDPLALIGQTETLLLNLRENLQDNPPMRQVAEVITGILHEYRQNTTNAMQQQIVHTGMVELDVAFGGMHPGELYVLAGRPGDGKTAISLQMAINAAKENKNVCYFSLEMSDIQLINRLLMGHSSINPAGLRNYDLLEEDLKEMERVAVQWENWPLWIEYAPSIPVEDLRAEVLLMNNSKGVNLVIIDYLHLLEGKPQRGENMEQVVARNVRMLKQLAIEAGCVVLVLSQMNRNSENRAGSNGLPQLNDLRDSGVIEQVADGVIFVYRPCRHGVTEDAQTGQSLEGICQLIIRKNRHGIQSTVNLRHNKTFTKFSNE